MEMLEQETLDALWVHAPPLPVVGPSMAPGARRAVYLEKPIARTLAGADRSSRQGELSKARICAVGYHTTRASADDARGLLAGSR